MFQSRKRPRIAPVEELGVLFGREIGSAFAALLPVFDDRADEGMPESGGVGDDHVGTFLEHLIGIQDFQHIDPDLIADVGELEFRELRSFSSVVRWRRTSCSID